MRRRCDQVVIPDPAHRSGWHSTGERQVIRPHKPFRNEPVPELWRKHAREPWKVIFPDLEWHLPDWDA
jgi:hypothetical protein